MLISHSHQFIFFHVPKVAGLSIADALKDYVKEPEKFKVARPPEKSANGEPNPMYEMWKSLLLHAKARDAQKELSSEVFDKYYKFAFVRNPWDWQISMYHFILQDSTNLLYKKVKPMSGFEEFLDWVINTKTLNIYPKGATKLQKDILTDKEGHLLVDFVGRYETLARDFQSVCQKLNLKTSLPHVHKSKHKDYRSYYNDETKAIVAEHFKVDIELFGYTFDGYEDKPILS
jgi:hypothetical protein